MERIVVNVYTQHERTLEQFVHSMEASGWTLVSRIDNPTNTGVPITFVFTD